MMPGFEFERAASCKGVPPFKSGAFGSAPACTRTAMTAGSGVARAAWCKGVPPLSSSGATGSAPARRQDATVSAEAHAKKSYEPQSSQVTGSGAGRSCAAADVVSAVGDAMPRSRRVVARKGVLISPPIRAGSREVAA